MLKKLFIVHCSLFIVFCVSGQDDERAQKIVDDMTARFKTYPSVSISFSATTTTRFPEESETELEGKIWVKGTKYKLETSEYVIYYDGSKIYQYMPTVNEVNIMKPDSDETDEDFQLLNPQSYFNISSKTFKSYLIQESSQNNRAVYEIDLYPRDVKTTKYVRIRITVDKTTLQLAQLKVVMRDGTHYTLAFKPYSIFQTALRDSFFTFNKQEHPNVEMIDLTF